MHVIGVKTESNRGTMLYTRNSSGDQIQQRFYRAAWNTDAVWRW